MTRQFRLEDLAIAAWNVAAVPVLGLAAASSGSDGDTAPVAGGLAYLAILGAVVAVAVRPTGQERPIGPVAIPNPGLIGPFIGGVGFVALNASAPLGPGGADGLVLLAFIACLIAMIGGRWVPTLDPRIRRLLILPFILVATTVFDAIVAQMLDGVDLVATIREAGVYGASFASLVAILLIGGLGVFYAALILAPRMIVAAEPDTGRFEWVMWAARFLLFVASAIFGIGWLLAISR